MNDRFGFVQTAVQRVEHHLREDNRHDRAEVLPVHHAGQRVRPVQRLAVQEGGGGVQAPRQGEEVHRARVHVQRGGAGGRQERDHQAGHRQEEAVCKAEMGFGCLCGDVGFFVQGPLVRWLKVNFSECFCAWIHVKALRVFVESVLR